MLSYEGLFFDEETVRLIRSNEKEALEVVNDELHCTFKYRPTTDEIFNELVGREFEISLIGYACNGQNSAFEISLPDELKKYYINYDEEDKSKLKVPHITVSLARGAKGVNSKYLNFLSLPKPIKVTGRFGYWIKEDDREYLSFEPYKK